MIHNYRPLGFAEGKSSYDDLEKRLAKGPVIAVPTITLAGGVNRAVPELQLREARRVRRNV